jgi:hypothetical protein
VATTTEQWFRIPESLYRSIRLALAGRDDALVVDAFHRPDRFGVKLYEYWAGRKHSYGLHEVLTLLEPAWFESESKVQTTVRAIKHTLAVEGLIWKWLEWAEADFANPERFKEAFREQFPDAQARWLEPLNTDQESFGRLLEGAATGIRGRERSAEDLGFDLREGHARTEVLARLGYMIELWQEVFQEYGDLWNAAQLVRYKLENG